MIFFDSCQKQTDTPSSSQSFKIKTYTEDVTSASYHSVITYNLTYDSQNRLISVESTTSPGDKFVYSYPQQNLFQMDLYNSNLLSIHEDFYLNSFSYVDSTFQYNDTNDSTTEKYVYNSAKQLIERREYFYQSTTG